MKKSKPKTKSGDASLSHHLQGNLPRKGESKTQAVSEPSASADFCPEGRSLIVSNNTSGAASLSSPGGKQRVMLPGEPKTTKYNIKSLKEGNLSLKLPLILDVYVHRAITEDSFLIGDIDDFIPLYVEPDFVKYIEIGKCYRLVKPIFENDQLLLKTIKPLAISPFNYAPLKETQADPLSIINSKDFRTFEYYANLPPSSLIPHITAKVVNLTQQRQSKFSQFRTATLKDVDSNRNFISLYSSFADQVVDGRVYTFKNIAVQNYKGMKDNYNRLSTRSNSSITAVDDATKHMFDKVHPGDGTLNGQIIGHEEPYMYLSCPFCKKANYETEDEKCAYCKKSTAGKDPTIDFNVTLIIQENNTDKFFHAFCFRSHLEICMSSQKSDELLEKLEELHFKKCKIDYLKDTEKENHIRVLKIAY